MFISPLEPKTVGLGSLPCSRTDPIVPEQGPVKYCDHLLNKWMKGNKIYQCNPMRGWESHQNRRTSKTRILKAVREKRELT